MSSLHIVGFGEQPKLEIKARIKWHHAFPDSSIELEPNDVIVLNLNEVHDDKQHQVLYDLVHSISQKGGTLVGVAGPNRKITRVVKLYDFLPFAEYVLERIFTFDSTRFHVDNTAPRWIGFFIDCIGHDMITPVYFKSIPVGAHRLILSGRNTVSFNYGYQNGRILILPSIKSIIHGEATSQAKSSLTNYLHCLYFNILSQYMEQSEPPPEWLHSIVVRNEEELKIQYDNLGKEIQRIRDEKKILVDDGHTLTRKVASHLGWLGFQTVEKEIEGKQDIEISEGEFKGLVECSGSVKHIKIGKLRQIGDYVITTGAKGILIGNPWRLEHPNSRNISEAFTEPVVKRAEELDICLVTVPHFYRVCLDTRTDNEKRKVRNSLKKCKGL